MLLYGVRLPGQVMRGLGKGRTGFDSSLPATKSLFSCVKANQLANVVVNAFAALGRKFTALRKIGRKFVFPVIHFPLFKVLAQDSTSCVSKTNVKQQCMLPHMASP